ncbi:MAG TPA: hypothetical protein VD978_19120 [Azospirillum sp.]|nr:hypothetical protein [Azospirillum sp.]
MAMMSPDPRWSGPVSPGEARRVPFALKLAYGGFIGVLVPVYWRAYGPENFLWLSDIALFGTGAAVITEKPLPAGMMAVGVLPLELAWSADILAGGKLLGLARYMFESNTPLYLRGLSLFHLALPPTLLWLLRRLGYDRRALRCQTTLTLAVLPLTYALTEPSKNINWVFGWGNEPQRTLPPLVYLAFEMALLPLVVLTPMHALLRRLFRPPGRA